MDVDTRELRAFVAVVDEGTFTDAAIRLRTSQASVSRAVQRLEAATGHRLLSRTSRQVRLTPAGDHVLGPARRILAILDQLHVAASSPQEELRVGYAWAALGVHTVAVQRAWSLHRRGDLVFVQCNTPTAGLLEGRCEVSVVRRAVVDPRLDSTRTGIERRYAVLADDHPLAARPTIRLADFTDQVVAVDVGTGTTREDLWGSGSKPARYRVIHGVDEWLTLIASGRALGISSEATVAQHPRPGIIYRLVEDAPPVEVRLVWWKESPPDSLQTLVDLSRAAYDSDSA